MYIDLCIFFLGYCWFCYGSCGDDYICLSCVAWDLTRSWNFASLWSILLSDNCWLLLYSKVVLVSTWWVLLCIRGTTWLLSLTSEVKSGVCCLHCATHSGKSNDENSSSDASNNWCFWIHWHLGLPHEASWIQYDPTNGWISTRHCRPVCHMELLVPRENRHPTQEWATKQ